MIEIGLKAKKDAVSGDAVQVIAVTGVWIDTTSERCLC